MKAYILKKKIFHLVCKQNKKIILHLALSYVQIYLAKIYAKSCIFNEMMSTLHNNKYTNLKNEKYIFLYTCVSNQLRKFHGDIYY